MRISGLTWFKSSYSSANGACIEVAHVPADFRTSSYTNANSANCVEVADEPHASAVRDTQNRDLGALLFGSAEWRVFLTTAKRDQL